MRKECNTQIKHKDSPMWYIQWYKCTYTFSWPCFVLCENIDLSWIIPTTTQWRIIMKLVSKFHRVFSKKNYHQYHHSYIKFNTLRLWTITAILASLFLIVYLYRINFGYCDEQSIKSTMRKIVSKRRSTKLLAKKTNWTLPFTIYVHFSATSTIEARPVGHSARSCAPKKYSSINGRKTKRKAIIVRPSPPGKGFCLLEPPGTDTITIWRFVVQILLLLAHLTM